MKAMYIVAIVVIAIVVIAGVFGVWWAYYRPTGTLEIAILAESTPEALTFTSSSILNEYKASHPGIDFVVDILPRDQFANLALRELTQKTGRYDIITGSENEIFEGRQNNAFYSFDNVQGVNAIDPNFTAQVRSDILSFCTNPATGKIDVLPITHWNSQCLFYRTDLFNNATEKANFQARYGYPLAPPQTWQQLQDIAQFFTRPPNLYGMWTTGGVGWALVYGEFWTWMQSMGGDIMSNNGTVTIDSNAWRTALEFQKNLTAYSPPNWQGSDWFTGLTLFEQGKIAMHEQFYFPWANFFNSSDVATEVLNNVGVEAPPFSPINESRGALTATPAEEMPIDAPHPVQAANFLLWMQSYNVQKEMALTGNLMLPIRADIDQDPTVNAAIRSSAIITMPGISTYQLVPLGPFTFYPHIGDCEPIIAEGYTNYMSSTWTLDQTISFLQTHIASIVSNSTS